MKNANSIRSLVTSYLMNDYCEKRGRVYFCKLCHEEIGIHKSEIRRHFIRNHYEIYQKTRDLITSAYFSNMVYGRHKNDK
jgi:hypothetical protein